jgi:hypothetical protein
VAEPDCFYRIDEERKNFDVFNFLKRWIISINQYFQKFSKGEEGKKRASHLLGTVYHGYMQVLLNYKFRKLDALQMKELRAQLFSFDSNYRLPPMKQFIFSVSERYNLLPLRIPGVNRFLCFLICL